MHAEVEGGVDGGTRPSMRYCVVRFVDGWKILVGGRRWGCFDFQVDAIDAAVRLAADATQKGYAPEILVQGPWGEVAPLRVA